MILGRCEDCLTEVSVSSERCTKCGKPGPFRTDQDYVKAHPEILSCPFCANYLNLISVSKILSLQEATRNTANGIILDGDPSPVLFHMAQTVVNTQVVQYKRAAKAWLWTSPVAAWAGKSQFWIMRKYYLAMIPMAILFAIFPPVGLALGALIITWIFLDYGSGKSRKKAMTQDEREELGRRERGYLCLSCKHFFPALR